MLVRAAADEQRRRRRVRHSARAHELVDAVGKDSGGDGDAPDAAHSTDKIPAAGSGRLVGLGDGRLEGGQLRVEQKAGTDGAREEEAHPLARGRVLVEQGEEAHADGEEGEAEQVDGLVAAPAADGEGGQRGRGDAEEGDGDDVDAGAGRGDELDGLEVDGNKKDGPVDDGGVQQGVDGDDDAGAGRGGEEARGHDGVVGREAAGLEEAKEQPGGEADEQRDERVPRGPGVAGAGVGERDEHGHGAADEDGVADEVEAAQPGPDRQVASVADAEAAEHDGERDGADGQVDVEAPAPCGVVDD